MKNYPIIHHIILDLIMAEYPFNSWGESPKMMLMMPSEILSLILGLDEVNADNELRQSFW